MADGVATSYDSSSSTLSAITVPPFAESRLPKTKRRRLKGPSQLFYNLINCGATKNHDMMMNSQRPIDPTCCSPREPAYSQHFSAPPRHESINEARWWNDTRDYSGQKVVVPAPAAYKPVLGPSCSQCGKQFKPEKMHKHMKSCPGMKK